MSTVNNKIQIPSVEYYVDLGLPSGVVWATRNIDVTQTDGFATTPYTYDCSYFSWGNTDGHNLNTGGTFDYEFSESGYSETSGSTIMTDIPLSADAARQNLGGHWRLPTVEDYEELVANTDCIDASGNVSSVNTVITINGVDGVLYRSKTNGNTIFFPRVGIGKDYEKSNSFIYWLGTISTGTTYPPTTHAREMPYGDGTTRGANQVTRRKNGLPIRPVFNFTLFQNQHINVFDNQIEYLSHKASPGFDGKNVSFIKSDNIIRYKK